MSRPQFFRALGLFVLDDFLEPYLCIQHCTEMSHAASKQGKIVLPTGEEVTDESVRRVFRAKVRGPNERSIRERLDALRPRLEEHFNISLGGSCAPEFLIYNEHGFYAPHTDASRDSYTTIRGRRVSVVVFLNAESKQPALGCYGGGKLTFHGILNEPLWANCAFSLDTHPGLLVAFRSDVLHEVTPVTFGQRFTIVSWFPAAASAQV